MRQFLTRLFLFTGLLCFVLLGMLLYQRYRPNPLAFQGPIFTRTLSETSHGNPTAIAIPNISLSLPVFKAKISGTTWETTEHGVSYLVSSPIPGEKGNAIIYGHNWPNLLGSLKNVDVGDTIDVTFEDGYRLSFQVAFVTIVTPEQIKILENSEDSRLTIYTCTGFLDSKRFVVTAIKN